MPFLAATRMSLSKKLVGTMIFTVLFISTLSLYVMLSPHPNEQAKRERSTASRVVEPHHSPLRNQVLIAASLMAGNPSAAMAVKGGKSDFLQQFVTYVMKSREGMLVTIADKNGNVIARGHSDTKDDSVGRDGHP
jgi:methyl-accepting chemotaxis protein